MEKKLGKATRDAYGATLVELGKDNPDIVVLDADLSKSTKTAAFQKAFPDRFFNVGIQEANLVGVAAGLRIGGRWAQGRQLVDPRERHDAHRAAPL